MVLLGFLLAAAASTVSDDAIRAQAARCGLKPDQLVWTKDAEGHSRADIAPHGNTGSFSFKSMMCLVEWAEKSGARIGFISEPAPDPKKVTKRVSQCGLGPISTRYDADLQEDILVAPDAKSATDAQLACADKAVGFYTLELPPSVQARFNAMRAARLSLEFQTQARAWLSARGLLDQLPKYQEGVTDDAKFTSQVESLCGPRAKGAFESKFGFHTLSPEWVERELEPSDRNGDVFSCLMNVTSAAGFKIGFIGNEYYQR